MNGVASAFLLHHRLGAEFFKMGTNAIRGQRGMRGRRQPVDDRRRRSRGHHDARPALGGHVLQADFRHGRRVRYRLQARWRGGRQYLQLAGLDMRADRDRIVEHHVDAAGDQVVERGRAALVGHVQHVDAGDGLEQFGHQMRSGADTGRAEGHLAGMLLGVGNELRHRVEGRAFEGDKEVRQLRHHMDRQEARQRVVGQVLSQRDIGRHGALGAVEDRIAVRLGAGRLLGADGAARPAPVVDQHGLAKRL